MKKIVSVLLVLLLAATTVFAGGKKEETAYSGLKKVKIGFLNYDPTSEQWLALESYFDYLSKNFNVEVMASEALDSAEQEMAFIDACAAAGCNVIYGYYNVTNEQALLRAAEKGMYYFGQGSNKAFNANPEVLNNPYYLGSFYLGNADYQYGYACMQALAEAGCHRIAGVSGGKDFGVTLFIDRWQGAMDALRDLKASGYDIELVYEVSGFPGTNGQFEAGQAAVLANNEIDGLYSTLTALMWIKPMQDAGKFGVIKVAAAGESMSEAAIGMFGAGFYVGTGTEVIDVFGSIVPVAINAVNGHPIRNADGTAPMIKAGWWKVTNVGDAAYYASVQGGDNGWVFSAEDIAKLLYVNNPEVSVADFEALYSAVTAAEIQSRR